MALSMELLALMLVALCFWPQVLRFVDLESPDFRL